LDLECQKVLWNQWLQVKEKSGALQGRRKRLNFFGDLKRKGREILVIGVLFSLSPCSVK